MSKKSFGRHAGWLFVLIYFALPAPLYANESENLIRAGKLQHICTH